MKGMSRGGIQNMLYPPQMKDLSSCNMQAMPLHIAIGNPMPSPKTNIVNEICQIALEMLNVIVVGSPSC
jgi:hypothetical protein